MALIVRTKNPMFMCRLSHLVPEKEALWSCVGYHVGQLGLSALNQEEPNWMVINDFWPFNESLWCIKPWERESTVEVCISPWWRDTIHSSMTSFMLQCSLFNGLIVLGLEWLKRGSGASQDEGLTLQHKDHSHPLASALNFSVNSLSTPDYSAGAFTTAPCCACRSSLSAPMYCFRLFVNQTVMSYGFEIWERRCAIDIWNGALVYMFMWFICVFWANVGLIPKI